MYGLALIIMMLSSFGCGFSVCTSRNCVLVSLALFRFVLGFGIGGDYPLSATIMSEFANKRTRGAFIAAVFSMQGFGILASSTVTMVVCAIFDHASHNVSKDLTPKAVDTAWRLILMLGAVPAGLTWYWRMTMPETARYFCLCLIFFIVFVFSTFLFYIYIYKRKSFLTYQCFLRLKNKREIKTKVLFEETNKYLLSFKSGESSNP